MAGTRAVSMPVARRDGLRAERWRKQMPARKAVLCATVLALTFAAGMSFGQGLVGPIDPELRAAQQSLNDAAMHLQRVRNPDDRSIVRARTCAAQALSEIDAGYNPRFLAEPPRVGARPPGK